MRTPENNEDDPAPEEVEEAETNAEEAEAAEAEAAEEEEGDEEEIVVGTPVPRSQHLHKRSTTNQIDQLPSSVSQPKHI